MKHARYKIYFLIIIIVILPIAVFVKDRNRTLEDYFFSSYENATEILYHERVSENRDIVFFLEDSGYISCSLLEKGWLGYQILRTSGKLNFYNSGYLCSFFRDNNDSHWIDWRVITDNTIKSVWTESGEMKMVECKPYHYRICWLLGNGKEPQNHIEKK